MIPNISNNLPQTFFNSSISSSTAMPTLSTTIKPPFESINHTVPAGFLVWNPGCQMPAMNPLAKDVMKLFHRGNFY